MAYPDSLLGEDEHVVVHHHPHWKMLLLPVLLFLLLVAAGTYGAALAAGLSWHLPVWIAIGAVGGLLVIWWTLTPLLRWRTTHYVITSHRFMVREGVFTRTGVDIPKWRINSVRFTQSLSDRVLGCGTLVVESASDEPLEFDDIPDVQRVHTLLYHEINDGSDDEHGWERR